MLDDIACADWVRRVLGFEISGAIRRKSNALVQWQAAKDTVDRQLQALSDDLRKSGVPVLADIAREITGMLAPVEVKLTIALQEYDAQPDLVETRATALKAVAETLGWLGTDERVKAVDTNPFGFAADVAGALGGALKRLQRELAPMQGASV